MFISSACFQKYEPFVDKSVKLLMAETVAPTPERLFVFLPIRLFNLAEIFICKQRSNKILTWYWRRHDTFCANRPVTSVTITFIRCLYRVTDVSTGLGDIGKFIYFNIK